jgi:hypothetical protein
MNAFGYLRLAALLGLLGVLPACDPEMLELRPSRADESLGNPAFNFTIETLSPSDTVAVGGTIHYNLYLRQQLTHVPGRRYTVVFRLPETYEGEATIYGQPWRSGDQVRVEYDQVVANNFRVGFAYRPLHRQRGTYAIAFSVTDAAGQQQTFSKRVVVR